MCQNKLFEMVCDIYSDSYGSCSEHICLVQLLGEEAMMEKCRNLGLNRTYPELYNQIENNMKVRGERQNES